MKQEVTLRIVLEKPPPGVDFGVQKGRGSTYETIQKQRSRTGDLSFEFTVGVRGGLKNAAPNLVGPVVQGPPGGRFIYIDIGTYAGQESTCWSRRLKIPLTGITHEMVGRLSSDEGVILETRVNGTGEDGGPSCGTVKPFEGWRLIHLTRR